MTTYYIAGRMSGDPYYAHKFRAAAADLREQGIDVVSPVELDEADGQQPKQVEPGGPEWRAFLARDIQIVARPDVAGVVVLPGWESSRGANLETYVARALGKVVLAYPSLTPVEHDEFERVDRCPDTGKARCGCIVGGLSHAHCSVTAGEAVGRTPTVAPNIVRDSIRTFNTGATRDTDEDKPDYEGYLSPRVLAAFGQYMMRHSVQSDGSRRPSDNWQKGIPQDAYMKSAWRHFVEWWTAHREGDDPVEALCALLFNTQGYLHEYLADKGARSTND